uniref:Uncharacterized protein n=1 Tax=Parascaris univalens TaxID=6257 RepID=A0A915BX25_PARUN
MRHKRNWFEHWNVRRLECKKPELSLLSVIIKLCVCLIFYL